MANTSKKRQQQKRQAIIRLVIMVGILVCVNIFASYFRHGIDLTEEKRFTLSPSTKKLLKDIKETVVIDVYLKGKFPSGIQRLQEATRERLQSFKDIAGAHIVFRFSDPFDGKNEDEKKKIFHDLAQKGVVGIPLNVKGDEDYSTQTFFPYALVQYNGREKAVSLLDNHAGFSPLEILNYSETLLEYKFAAAIRDLSLADKPRIAYMVGNGEPLNILTYDMLSSLTQYYHVDTVDLTRGIRIPSAYDAIIIDKPTIPFAEPEKLKIDQYVMHGGHVLWAISTLNTPMDSLRSAPQFLGMDYGLNLDDILFKYGTRINSDVIEDMQCVSLPRVNSMTNSGRPEVEYKEWPYYPVLNASSQHPIVRNMGPVLSKFPASIDTISSPSIKKTILLQSSKYSRTASSPVRVSLSIMNFAMRPEMFNKPYRPVAVLLEGKFHSVFEHRLARSYLQILDSLKEPFKPVCDSGNSMIVISDGNMIMNEYSPTDGPYEMGYWQYSKDYFSNKSFFLNCLEYLTDHSGLVEARSKDMRLRLLDLARVKSEKTQWQLINICIPIVLVLVFASAYTFFRKRRYEVKQESKK